MADQNKSSSNILVSTFGSALWGLGLLIHAILICTAVAVLFNAPEFPSNVGEQAKKATAVIDEIQGYELGFVEEANAYEIKEKSKFRPPVKNYVQKLAQERSKVISNRDRLADYQVDSKVYEINKEMAEVYNDAFKKECPSCHLWISPSDLYKEYYHDNSIASVKYTLDRIGKYSNSEMLLWIIAGKISQILVLAMLLYLTYIFWYVKKGNFLNWLENLLLLLSPTLLIAYVVASTTQSLKYYDGSGFPSPNGYSSSFWVGVLVFGILGLFILTPAAFTIRKHRKAKLHE